MTAATREDLRGMIEILNTIHDLKMELAVTKTELMAATRERDYYKDWVERLRATPKAESP